MSYSGNKALSAEIQGRILETFRQTLALVESSASQEALLGCDFILRLDPLFEPARTLHKRLLADSGSVDTKDLRALVDAPPPETPSVVDMFTVDAPTDEPEPLESTAPEADEIDLPLEPAIDSAPRTVSHLEQQVEKASVLEQPSPEIPVVGGPDPVKPNASVLVDNEATLKKEAIDSPTISSQTSNEEPYEPATEKLSRDEIQAIAVEASEVTQAHERPPVEEGSRLSNNAAEVDDQDINVTSTDAVDPAQEDFGQNEAAEREESAEFEDAGDKTLDGDADFDDLDQPEAESNEKPLVDLGSALDSESEQRIQDLLAEGQQALESGEFQSAIDSWSRIFLIDIDHAEANLRIEEARKLKAESDRELEEAFHEGVVLLDDKNFDEARIAFERVLQMQPNHLAAQQQLEKIANANQESPPVTSGIHVSAVSEDPPTGSKGAPSVDEELISKSDFGDLESGDPSDDPFGELSIPKAKAAKSKISLYVGAAVLLLVLVGGWILIQNWNSIFPNSGDKDAAVRAAPEDPIARATALQEAGKTAMALAQLRRLPPESPAYAEAQPLIAQWETESSFEDDSDQPSPAELERRSNHIQMANFFYQDQEFLRVLEHLDAAALVTPLDEAEDSMRATSQEALSAMQSQIDLFEEGDWEFAVRSLWDLHQADPNNKDVKRLLVDSYFNLGYRDLQRSDPVGAVGKLTEAVTLAPGDSEASRLLKLAQTYETRPPDLLYQIYIKYQTTR